MKTCKGCGADKPLDDYYSVAKKPNTLHVNCKPCHAKIANYGPNAKTIQKRKHYKKTYGLTLEAALALLALGCAVCGSSERLGIDHDHTSGLVRAALCSHCNSALGMARDCPDRLRALALYLEAHRV